VPAPAVQVSTKAGTVSFQPSCQKINSLRQRQWRYMPQRGTYNSRNFPVHLSGREAPQTGDLAHLRKAILPYLEHVQKIRAGRCKESELLLVKSLYRFCQRKSLDLPGDAGCAIKKEKSLELTIRNHFGSIFFDRYLQIGDSRMTGRGLVDFQHKAVTVEGVESARIENVAELQENRSPERRPTGFN